MKKKERTILIMEEEQAILVKALDSSYFEKLLELEIPKFSKNNRESENLRNKGNEFFKKKNHDEYIHAETWFYYSKSIAAAENDSDELALAYGNRSAILLHMTLYEACIMDVDRALNITKRDYLLIKLLLRKTKCLMALGLPECRTVFQEVESLLDTINDQSLKKSIEKEVKQVTLFLSKPPRAVSPMRDPRLEKLNALTAKHKINDFSAAAINSNRKYGRHLVAAKDFEPGDTIFIEKPYIRCPHLPFANIYCSYCFTMTYASIPCDHCSWAMFCSEECKKKAWDEYHDIECAVYSSAKENSKDFCKQLALGALILGLKEFGSIENLKNELLTFDKSPDTTKGFIKDDSIQIDGFKTIYNLSKDMSNNILEKHINSTLALLKSLAINTTLFGNDFEWRKADSYKANEDVIFLASLLLRLSKISELNGLLMWNSSWGCRMNLDRKKCLKSGCCIFGSYIAPVTNLLNHSCDPNASRCYSRAHTVIVYALKPIKKGEQIFDCYTEPFYEENITDRQKALSKFTFKCDCEACQNNWPDGSKLDITRSPVEMEIAMKFPDLSLPSVCKIEFKRDEKTIQNYKKAINIALTKLPYLSSTPLDLIDDMKNAFVSIYGLNFGVPHQCMFF